MPLFRKTLSIPNRSPDSSVSSSKKHGERVKVSPVDGDERTMITEKRLTRQRKLRYATDEELGLNWGDSKPRLSIGVSSPSHNHWSLCATPQPLPLPDSPLINKQSRPSIPKPCSLDQASKALCRSAPSSSNFDKDSAVVPKNFDTLRLHIPPRSAPTSGLSSPNITPPGIFVFNCISDFSHDQHIIKSFKTSPKSAPSSNLGSPNLYSPEASPDLQTPNGSFKKSPKFQPNSHPLPLPPSPSSSFVPSPPRASNHTVKTEGRTIWQKGPLIGRGTYGSVFRGTNRVTGASCAIKEVDIILDDPNSKECVKQLEQEINVLSHLEHRNIVRYFGSEIIGEHLNIYLEYVHPGSLSKYVKEHCGQMTESIVRNFTRHIVCGLAYLHSRKTVHRDIKGANLLVDQTGTVKLADFGTAKHLTGLSSQLSLKGSPHWMAPELMKAVMQKDASPDHAYAVDIWSLGCTIIEMFTGNPPWGQLSGPQAMFKVLNRSPPIPEKLSREGKDFLGLCFRRDPAERPSAASLLDHPFVKLGDELSENEHAHEEMQNRNSEMNRSPAHKVAHGVQSYVGPNVCNRRSFESLHNHPLAQITSHGREVPHA